MLEPPSATLLKTLSAHRLCTPRDLRRCRGYVRRQTYDLPAFDSVWIDALVQSRRLTAYQAQCLELGFAEKLSVGPCVLLELLGETPHAATYVARRRDAQDVCVLKLTAVAPEQIKPLSDRLTKLVAVAPSIPHPAIVLPQAAQVLEWPAPGEWRLVTIGPQVRGPHLSELLIRRGRYPIAVVVEIGRQLLDGLAALEARGLVHGDVTLTNVRINRHGQAVLVDAAIVPALRPEFSFHNILRTERYDGLAPERITTGHGPTVASDIYGLGCLLWQLLAGRPPFTVGDPLAKLAAHQTQTVGDIREWVPDVPQELAELLRHWTAPNPAARPRSFRDAAAELGAPTRAGRRRLANFRGAFDRTAPRGERTERTSRWPLAVAVLFVLTGAVLSLFDQGARNYLLSVARVPSGKTIARTANMPTAPQETTNDRSATNEQPATQPLPEPDGDGLITLATGARYFAADVALRGVLDILGDPEFPAEVVISDRSLTLWADHVRIENVRFVREPSRTKETSGRPRPLVVADCQQLEISACRFEQAQTNRAAAAIAWRPQEPRRRATTRIDLKDVVFSGAGVSMYLGSLPAALQVNNVLKSGGGDFVQLRDEGGLASQWHLRQVTLRESGPLLRWWPRRDDVSLSTVSMSVQGCVWDLNRPSASANVVRPTLVAWMARRLPPNWNSAIEWRIAGSLVSLDTNIATLIDPASGHRTTIDETQLDIDGLSAAPFEFSGPISPRPGDSRLKTFEAALPEQTTLGIDPDRLPTAP